MAFYSHFVMVLYGVAAITRNYLENSVTIQLHIVSEHHHTLSKFFRLRSVIQLSKPTQTKENALIFAKKPFKVELSQVSEYIPLFGEFVNRRVVILLLDSLDELLCEILVSLVHQHTNLTSSLLILRSHFRQSNSCDYLWHIFSEVELGEVRD